MEATKTILLNEDPTHFYTNRILEPSNVCKTLNNSIKVDELINQWFNFRNLTDFVETILKNAMYLSYSKRLICKELQKHNSPGTERTREILGRLPRFEGFPCIIAIGRNVSDFGTSGLRNDQRILIKLHLKKFDLRHQLHCQVHYLHEEINEDSILTLAFPSTDEAELVDELASSLGVVPNLQQEIVQKMLGVVRFVVVRILVFSYISKAFAASNQSLNFFSHRFSGPQHLLQVKYWNLRLRIDTVMLSSAAISSSAMGISRGEDDEEEGCGGEDGGKVLDWQLFLRPRGLESEEACGGTDGDGASDL